MKLTVGLLTEKGFQPEIVHNQLFLKKGHIAITFNYQWIPCRIINGIPLCTNCYVETWEEFEKLISESENAEKLA